MTLFIARFAKYVSFSLSRTFDGSSFACGTFPYRLIFSCVKLSIGSDVDEKDAHSSMLGPNVSIHVRDLFRTHLTVGTLEPRSLATSVPYVSSEVRFPSESAWTVRTAEFLRLVPPDAETTTNWNKKRSKILAHSLRASSSRIGRRQQNSRMQQLRRMKEEKVDNDENSDADAPRDR